MPNPVTLVWGKLFGSEAEQLSTDWLIWWVRR